MTDNKRLKMIEETVREFEQSYYRIWLKACSDFGEESIRALMIKAKWSGILSARMMFDDYEHLLRMHDFYCKKEVN